MLMNITAAGCFFIIAAVMAAMFYFDRGNKDNHKQEKAGQTDSKDAKKGQRHS